MGDGEETTLGPRRKFKRGEQKKKKKMARDGENNDNESRSGRVRNMLLFYTVFTFAGPKSFGN